MAVAGLEIAETLIVERRAAAARRRAPRRCEPQLARDWA
jgi:hypothetical protein